MALSAAEVAIVKGMLARRDRQSDIAAYFGENIGRISEINTGLKWESVTAASPDDLPPPGPYFISGRAAIRAKETLSALRDLIDETLHEIEAWETSSKV
ncbi:MAG: hypothetical protein WBB98_17415 [Xanthobacteraceae bacterium]